MSTWQDCPRRWYSQYIEKIRSDSEASVRGSIAHAILEDFVKLPAAERTYDVLLELNTQHLREYDGEFKGPAMSKAVTDRINAAWHLERYSKLPGTYVEEPIEFTTAGGGNVMRGFCDRGDRLDNGELWLTDYKSGRFNPKYSAKSVSTQLGVYALAFEKRGEPVTGVRGVYLGSGTNPSNIVIFRYSADDLLYVEQWIDSTVAEIHKAFEVPVSRDDMDTSTGPLCNYCPIKHECEAPKAEGIRIT